MIPSNYSSIMLMSQQRIDKTRKEKKRTDYQRKEKNFSLQALTCDVHSSPPTQSCVVVKEGSFSLMFRCKNAHLSIKISDFLAFQCGTINSQLLIHLLREDHRVFLVLCDFHIVSKFPHWNQHNPQEREKRQKYARQSQHSKVI